MFPRSYYPMVQASRPYAVQSGGYIYTGEFNEVGIEDIKVQRYDCDVSISWTPVSTFVGPDEWFQVYVNGQLKAATDTTEVILPGLTGRQLIIHVGHVAPENRDVDYGARLVMPAHPGNRARLTWYGGTWIDPDQVGFRIYMSDDKDMPVNLGRPVATLPATINDTWGAGFGGGPFGVGPFGASVVPYNWTSGVLRPGRWEFCVMPYDRAGNLPGNPPVVTLEITGPPPAPPMVGGRRLWLDSYDAATGGALLKWNPSI